MTLSINTGNSVENTHFDLWVICNRLGARLKLGCLRGHRDMITEYASSVKCCDKEVNVEFLCKTPEED